MATKYALRGASLAVIASVLACVEGLPVQANLDEPAGSRLRVDSEGVCSRGRHACYISLLVCDFKAFCPVYC